MECAPGDRITLFARNSRAWWETTLAAIHAGVVTVPANWHWKHEELAYVLSDSGSRVLVVDAEFLEIAQGGDPAPRAIGMTDECAVGHYAARLLAIDHWMGDGRVHLRTLARSLGDHSVLDPLDTERSQPREFIAILKFACHDSEKCP